MDLLQCEMNRLFYLWMNRSNCKFSNKKPSQARRFQLRFGLQNEFQFNFEVLKEERTNERTKQKKNAVMRSKLNRSIILVYPVRVMTNHDRWNFNDRNLFRNEINDGWLSFYCLPTLCLSTYLQNKLT